LKIFYLCPSGDFAGVICGALHLGGLSATRIPTRREIIQMRRFGESRPQEIGNPLFLGVDQFGNQVYSIGVLQENEVALRTINDLMRLFHIPGEEVIVADTVPCGGWRLKLAGLVSRWGLRSLGYRLAVTGILRCYPALSDLVARTVASVRQRESGPPEPPGQKEVLYRKARKASG
jgi:hypothetical protein